MNLGHEDCLVDGFKFSRVKLLSVSFCYAAIILSCMKSVLAIQLFVQNVNIVDREVNKFSVLNFQMA